MKLKKIFLSILILTSFLLFNNCSKESFTFPSAKDVPIDAKERVEKNIEEGRGFSLGGVGKRGGTFDFASSNELWRASIEILDFVSFTNASYSGGLIITDWFSGSSGEGTNQRNLKITVNFLSNEVRADAIDVIIHEKICSVSDINNCTINKIQSDISNEIKLAILKKATIFKKEGIKKSAGEVKKKRAKNLQNQ